MKKGEKALLLFMKMSGMKENEFIFEALKESTGMEVEETIWEPVKN